MGVTRGDFEKVVETSRGPREARLSTDVPDVGAPLLLVAPALKGWGDMFGKMASIGTDYTRRKNKAEAEMLAARQGADDASRARADVEGRDMENATQKEREAWQAELALAKEREANAIRIRNLATQRWNRTGFFGLSGTLSYANDGKGAAKRYW